MGKEFRSIPAGTAEHVVAHAKWRKSRGRQPSMGYMGKKNPTKALKLAQQVADAKVARREQLKGLLMFAAILPPPVEMTDNTVNLIIAAASNADEAREMARTFDIILVLETRIPRSPDEWTLSDAAYVSGGKVLADGSLVLGGLVISAAGVATFGTYDDEVRIREALDRLTAEALDMLGGGSGASADDHIVSPEKCAGCPLYVDGKCAAHESAAALDPDDDDDMPPVLRARRTPSDN